MLSGLLSSGQPHLTIAEVDSLIHCIADLASFKTVQHVIVTLRSNFTIE